jgi:hypothetical protein
MDDQPTEPIQPVQGEQPAKRVPLVQRRILGMQPKWWLPILLVVLILAILGGAYAASHRGSASKATATATRTPTPAATATLAPTATPAKKKPTATARVVVVTATAGPATATPTAPPATSTPHPSATSTPTVRTGTISHTQAELQRIQQGANNSDPNYTFYLDPFQVAQKTLPNYGFTTVNIISPTPVPTPTPYTGNSGLPEVQLTVQYQGKQYLIVLDQPVQQGPQGIWVIVRIKPL